jgi:general secretion pathway protein G
MVSRIPRRSRGFTLIELMIVISMIIILLAIAVPIYNRSIQRSKEAVLRQNLFTLRQVISEYTLDKQKAPGSLQDLVQGGYLKEVPVDPCTGSRDTWVTEQEDVSLSVDQTAPGISDVHSGCNLAGTDGTPISSW